MIINRPLDRPVAELVSGTPPPGFADVPVFLGGPVGKNQLMFAAFEWQKGTGLKLNHNIALDEARRPGAEKSAYSLRVCGLRRLGGRSTRKRGKAESVGDSKRQSFAAETGSSAKSLVRHHADSRSVVQNARCRTG